MLKPVPLVVVLVVPRLLALPQVAGLARRPPVPTPVTVTVYPAATLAPQSVRQVAGLQRFALHKKEIINDTTIVAYEIHIFEPLFITL